MSRWRDIHERPHPVEPDSRVGHQSCAEINLLMKGSSWFCVGPAGSDSHSPIPRWQKVQAFLSQLSVNTWNTEDWNSLSVFPHQALVFTMEQLSSWKNDPCFRKELHDPNCHRFHCGGDQVFPVCCSAWATILCLLMRYWKYFFCTVIYYH